MGRLIVQASALVAAFALGRLCALPFRAPTPTMPAAIRPAAAYADAAAASTAAAAPPLNILVAHEQHLQRVGSDRRLLALLQTLRSLGSDVSLLIRTKTCNRCVRSPSTRELARSLQCRGVE